MRRPASLDVQIPPPARSELADLEGSAAAAARLMKLLSSEPRLILVCRMMAAEASVGELARRAGLAPPAASQHLAKLRAEGLVATRREGQTVFYRISDPDAVRIVQALCEVFPRRRN